MQKLQKKNYVSQIKPTEDPPKMYEENILNIIAIVQGTNMVKISDVECMKTNMYNARKNLLLQLNLYRKFYVVCVLLYKHLK